MNYPFELLRMVIRFRESIKYRCDRAPVLELVKEAYKLGLEKGWQYQQEEDNASRQWENNDE